MDFLTIFIVVSTCFMVFLSFLFFRLIDKRLKPVKLEFDKIPRTSLIDNLLLYHRTPFAWRLGFTLAILDYDEEQIESFIAALKIVISEEKRLFDIVENSKNKRFINKLRFSKNKVTKIETYSTLLKSHSVINNSNPENSLEYILFGEIDNFLHKMVKTFKKNRPNYDPPMKPPF